MICRCPSVPVRRGTTVLELAVAMLLIGLAMVMTARMVSWMALERRALERRQWALREAENVLERLTAAPWNDLTGPGVAAMRLGVAAEETLPGGSLDVDLADDPGGRARRVRVVLRWDEGPAGPARPVRLTAWAYREGAGR